MRSVLLTYYPWLTAGHLLAVIAWMAAMFYLPRLFVYHTMATPGGEADGLFKKMEIKLQRIIMTPAMIAAWAFGMTMLYANPALLTQGWFHLKLTAVVLMSAAHGMFCKWRKDFARDNNKHSEKFYRIINEVPTVLLIVILISAAVKPIF
jgi:putative membrane protein